MKKRAFFILGVVALSAVSSAATIAVMRGMDRNDGRNISYAAASAESDIFRQNPAVDVAFASSVVSTDYPDLTYAAENAVKAVVNIEAIQQVEMQSRRDPFLEFFGFPQGGYSDGRPQMREARAGGSGVIISEDGYIVTNNHVIDSATKVRVKLNDGRVFDAKIIGADPATDVALIKVEAEGLPTLPFGSSDDLRLGEWVLAIGYPMELQSTITAGIGQGARSGRSAQRVPHRVVHTDRRCGQPRQLGRRTGQYARRAGGHQYHYQDLDGQLCRLFVRRARDDCQKGRGRP